MWLIKKLSYQIGANQSLKCVNYMLSRNLSDWDQYYRGSIISGFASWIIRKTTITNLS